jgi:hypothetical protein
MKKNLTVLLAALLMGGTAFGQAVSDRNIIPVAVNLNQVLRMTITNGGNIEFVFNTIDEYKNGISGDAAVNLVSADMYQTDFTVSSSTRWKISYGAESATFLGVDDPGNTLALDNVGFTIVNNGAHLFESTGPGQGVTATEELWDDQQNAEAGLDGEPAALVQYPVDLIEDNDSGTQANAGDATDNSFTLVWRCGTGEDANTVAPMATEALIDQSPSPDPDRYVANVLFELAVDN